MAFLFIFFSALFAGFAAIGFASALKWLEEFFDHMKKIPAVLHPAIGALGLGIVGYFFPRVFGPGYATIGDVLNVRLALTAVVLLLIFKAAVVLLSLGSGTSGGTLAPMFMMSAAIGSTFAMVVNYLVPERAPFRGRVRRGGHGSTLVRLRARDIYVHGLRDRNDPRFSRRGAASSWSASSPTRLPCAICRTRS